MRSSIVRSVSLLIVAVLCLGLLTTQVLRDTQAVPLWLLLIGAATLGFALLVSERSRATSEKRFRTLVEHSKEVLMEVSDTLQVTYASPSTNAVLGYEPGELQGRDPRSFIHPDDRERVDFEAQMVLGRPGEPRSLLCRFRGKDGRYRWLDCAATNVLGADGIHSIAVSMRDVTERVQAEHELRESEKRFRALIEKSSDGIALSSGEGKFLYLGPSTERILGWGAGEMVGREVSSFVHPDDLPHRGALLATLRQNPGTVAQSIPMRMRHKDGRWLWLEAIVTNLLDDPSVAAIVTNYRDVTERKAMEERIARHTRELERSNRELEEFAYVASHDLQEPLRMVASYVQLLERRYRGMLDSDADQYIQFAVDGATRMKQLINDLLDYSRLYPESPREEVDLGALMKGVLANLEGSVRECGAVVDVGPLPVLRANPTQMLRLLQNLIGNAIKFRHEDVAPVVRVRAACEEGTWCIAVEDDGIGIDPAYAEQVFAIFRRLHDKAAYGGTGIGLAVAKKIVEQHGGEIWFESTPGEGTSFYFTIRTAT